MTMTLTILLCVLIVLADGHSRRQKTKLDNRLAGSDNRLDQLDERLDQLTANITLDNARLRACTALRVAFTAGLYISAGNMHLGVEIVIHNVIIENAGDDYNNYTGIFTCAEPGVYSFTVHSMKNNSPGCLGLKHNGNWVSTVESWGGRHYDAVSIGATIKLRLNDTVKVVGCTSTSGGGFHHGPDQASIFMGHLVHGDACL